MSELLSQVTNVWLAIAVALLIALWGFGAWSRFRARMAPLNAELERLCALMREVKGAEAFAERFQALDKAFSESALLGHQWREFRETLIWPSSGSERQVVYNTQTAGAFFSRDELLNPHVDLRFYAAMPNLLTGAGILGTFIGLVIGIYLAAAGLTDPDPRKAQQAVGGLLSGAWVAFLTSIAGLVASILFSWREKHWLHRFERMRREWVAAVDARVERLTPEKIGIQSLALQKQYARALTEFTDQLAFQLAEAINRTVPEALDERVTAPLTRALEELRSAVKALAEKQTRMGEDLLTQVVEQFRMAVEGAAGQEMREFANALQGMTGELRAQIAALGEQKEALRRSSAEAVAELSRAFTEGAGRLDERVAKATDEILEGLGTAVEEMTSLLSGGTERMVSEMRETASVFERVTGEFTQAADKVEKVLSGAEQLLAGLERAGGRTQELQESLQKISVQVGAAVDQVAEASGALVKAGERVHEAMSRLQATVKDIDEIHRRLQSAWAAYEKRFEGVDRALAGVFEQIEQGLDRFRSSMQEFVQGIDEHAARITGHLAGATEDLGERIEELVDMLGRARR